MAPRETENNAYAKFWGDKQRTLWCVMVFSGVANSFFLEKVKLPLATRVIVFGHMSKEMLSPKPNARDNIPSHFFALALAVYRRLSAFV